MLQWMIKTKWGVVGPGHCAMREVGPLARTAAPYCQVAKYFMRDLSKQLISERMVKYLGDSDSELALEILERGL
eukprot:2442423-Pyramimonas_sp.AAC.1